MRSLDTNVLLRFILLDDDAQLASVRPLFNEPVAVCATVLNEIYWVLSSTYGFDRGRICDAFDGLFDLPSVSGPPHVAWAIENCRAGADFADAMHLATSLGSDAFVTFDRALHRRLAPTAPVAVELLDA
jgi:predicted nucleic-acid-binding protein